MSKVEPCLGKDLAGYLGGEEIQKEPFLVAVSRLCSIEVS